MTRPWALHDSLYEFFITDDRARMKSFSISTCIGVLVGLMFYLAGYAERIAGTGAAVSSLVAVMSCTYVYARSKNSAKVITSLKSQRRPFLRLSLVAAVSEFAEVLMSSERVLLGYVSEVATALKSDAPVSLIVLFAAQSSIASKLQKQPPPRDIGRLEDAYATLAAAQNYEEIRPYAVVATQTDEIPGKSVIWARGLTLETITLYSIYPIVNVELSVKAAIFSRVSIIAPAGLSEERRKGILAKRKWSVIMIDCHLERCRQDLSGITWFDTIFENCTIETKGDVLLVNVTFKGCSVRIANSSETLIRLIGNGNAEGITFSSRAEKIVAMPS